MGRRKRVNLAYHGEPTHREWNTLNLAWTNISEATAWVDLDEFMAGS